MRILLIMTLLFSAPIFSNDKVAKIVFLKGTVEKFVKGKSTKLKKGDWLEEGVLLQSQVRSIAKIIFTDKSKMVLGPKSKLRIETFKKTEPGVINLIKGSVRSTVSKNYMNIKKGKSKLFIKTKTAAMGVRGTDYKVLYNTQNKVTSLVTFEGAVAMAKLSAGQAAIRNQAQLERIVSSPDAVMVRRGQYSGTLPGFKKVSLPVKMSPAQVDAMEKNELGATSSKKETKQRRNIIPPKVSSKSFIASDSSVDKEVSKNIGKSEVLKLRDQVQNQDNNSPPPEGFVDGRGRIAPASGGYIDEKTALYVPPTKGSEFDPNAGVFVPDPSQGTFDKETGEYIPPKGYKLIPQGEFVKIAPDGADGGRLPASTTTATTSDGTAPTTQLVIKTSADQMGALELEQNALEFQRFNHQQFNNGGFDINIQGTTRVRFIIE